MALKLKVQKKLKYFDMDLSLSCEDGRMVVLIGPSGGGQTTLVRMLTTAADATCAAWRNEGVRPPAWSSPEAAGASITGTTDASRGLRSSHWGLRVATTK